MELSKSEVAKLRRLLSEIDKEATVKGRPNVIGTRTRNARLILTKAERRDKNSLFRNE